MYIKLEEGDLSHFTLDGVLSNGLSCNIPVIVYEEPRVKLTHYAHGHTHTHTHTHTRTKESACDNMLPHGLSVALGCDALDQAREEVNHLWLSHLKGDLGRDVSIKHISASINQTMHGCLTGACCSTIRMMVDIMWHMRYSRETRARRPLTSRGS